MSFKIKISNVGNGQKFTMLNSTQVYQVLRNDFLFSENSDLEYFDVKTRQLFVVSDPQIPVLFLNF